MVKYEFLDDIPMMDMQRTALFAGTREDLEPDAPADRAKVRADVESLLGQGYDTFVVSYGSAYGSQALRELLQLKREGQEFRLITGKAQREPEGLLKDSVQILFDMLACEAHIGPRYYKEWLRDVIPQISMISHEDGMTRIDGVAPDWLVSYFEEMDRSSNEGRALVYAPQVWE